MKRYLIALLDTALVVSLVIQASAGAEIGSFFSKTLEKVEWKTARIIKDLLQKKFSK
jgi:hypothetical protein